MFSAGPDFPYGTVPSAPHLDGKTYFFLFFLCLLICLENAVIIPKAPGASSPGLVPLTNLKKQQQRAVWKLVGLITVWSYSTVIGCTHKLA